jgi:hypothetical protein
MHCIVTYVPECARSFTKNFMRYTFLILGTYIMGVGAWGNVEVKALSY